jgi:hypothetical protein
VTEPDKIRRELTGAQGMAVALLVMGASISQAAKASGVSRQTCSGWVNHHPYFRAELNRRREEVWAASKDRLRFLLPVALTALEHELRGGEASYKAALALLKLAGMGNADYGEVGPTDANQIIDEEVRAHRPDPLTALADNLNGGPVTDRERRAVLDKILAEAEREGT